MQKRLICIVHGRVQGVFFRDTTSRHARALALTGFVENDSHNTVRVVAEGEEDALQELLAYVQKGPPLARVERVEETWEDASGEFVDFHIRYRNFLDRF